MLSRPAKNERENGEGDQHGRGLRSVRPMRNRATNDTDRPALQRDPDEWKTGDEPMTDAQRSYLETLGRETDEEFDETLKKARDARSGTLNNPESRQVLAPTRSRRRSRFVRTWKRRSVSIPPNACS